MCALAPSVDKRIVCVQICVAYFRPAVVKYALGTLNVRLREARVVQIHVAYF